MGLLSRAGFALGGLSILVLLLGLAGLASAPYLASAAALCAAAFAASLRGLRLRGQAACFTFAEKSLWLLSAIFALAPLPLALLPPSVRDELIQHLALPALYLAEGAIFEMPGYGFSYLPMNLDLVYMLLLSLGSDVAPRVAHLAYAALTAAVVYCYLAPLAGRAWACVGFMLYLSTPLVFNLSRMAYIDNGVAFYAALALFAALKWKDGQGRGWLYCSAIAVGLAMGAKYNALITLLLLTCFVAAVSVRKDGARGLRDPLLYAVVALAVLSPWLVRNYVWTGSPFYPLFETVASSMARGEGVHVTGEMSPVVKRYALYGEGTLRIVLLPLRIFWEGADNSIERFDGVLNPFLLVFLLMAIGARERNSALLAAYAVLFFIMAALTVDIAARYLMPALPAVVALATLGIRRSMGRRLLRPAAAAFLVLMFAFNGRYAWGLYQEERPFQVLIGAESEQEYLSRALPDYDAVAFANRSIPEGSKVLLLFAGDRGYYWERDYAYGDRTGAFFKAMVRGSGAPEALAAQVRARFGATHVFLNEKVFERFLNDNFSATELALVADLFNGQARRLYRSNGFALYELR